MILFEGIPHPVKCDKIRYYEDKRFTARLLAKVDVPMLQLEGSVPVGKRTIAALVVIGMVLAGLAEASRVVAEPTHAGTSMSADRSGGPAADSVKRLVDQFLDFVGRLNSTSELVSAHVESGLRITLKKNDNGEIYRSPDLGGGWLYGVELLKAGPHMKTGLAFGFYNYDRSADPSAVCAVSLDDVRASLTSHGYVENITPGEHGQIVAWNFVKSDIVMTVIPGDLVARADGTECVRSMQTTDGY